MSQSNGQTIDRKVVEMKFDNKQFESGVSVTMATLSKLKKSLDFSKVGDSFSNIEKAAGKVDMKGLSGVIDGIQNKFSTMEVAAITAISNITNSIVNSAKRWVSAVTIDPIKTGFQEYETQINAVQTILANTQKEGTNIKQVNAALDELNTYADKTIYNFTEMTRNIGTFTAAGVDLRTSVEAIQGIANLAAVSGSNSQQASTAMYQLSQALATGTIRLMDWNSVVNAGMGGQLFQDALKETSRELKTGADAAIDAAGSFRESLKSGWLTSEVLTETLKKFTSSGAAEYVSKFTGLSKEAVEAEVELAKSTYDEAEAMDKAAEALANKSGKNKEEIADALKFAQTAEDAATKVKTFTQLIDTTKEALQSGWSQSFRIIVGDFEDAKTLFTEISDAFGAMISASNDARNNLLSEVFNKKNTEDYLADLVHAPKEAIDELEIVAKETGVTSDLFKKTLNEFTYGDKVLNNVMSSLVGVTDSEKDLVKNMSEALGISANNVRALQLYADTAGIASDKFQNFVKKVSKGNPEMQKTINKIFEIREALQKPSGRELLIDSLRDAVKGLLSVIKPVKEAFDEVFPAPTADRVYGMLESFREFTKTLTLSKENSDNLKKAFKGLFDIAKLLGDGFIALVKLIIPVEEPIGAIGDGILGIAGALGSLLSTFANAVRSSVLLSKAFKLLQMGSSGLMRGLAGLIRIGITFVSKLSKLEGTAKLINSVNKAFERLYSMATPYIDVFIKEVEDFINTFFKIEDVNIDDILNVISQAFADLAWEIDHFDINNIDFGPANKAIDFLKRRLKGLVDWAMSNEGFEAFVHHMQEYSKELSEALKIENVLDRIERIISIFTSHTKVHFEELEETFSMENILNRMEKVMSIFGKFFNWIKNTFGPAFKDFSVGSAVGAAGGFGVIYSLIKFANAFASIAKTFEGVSKSLGQIPGVLGAVRGAIVAYQKDLKATAILKIAGAIAILAGALVLLSFADPDRLMGAALSLTLVSGVLLFGISALLGAVNKGKDLNDAIYQFSKGLKKSMKNLTKAVKIKAIGDAVKSFAESIAIIVASIVAIGIMWRKDPEAFEAALKTVGGIAGVLLAFIAIVEILAQFPKTKGMEDIGKSILMLAASLGLIVYSISKLLKMEMPNDADDKIKLLKGVIMGMGALAVVLALAARLAGGNQLPKMSSTIKSLAILMVATVLSLKTLLKMQLPSDYETKLDILKGIFVGFGAIILAMGVAARISKGNGLKAAASILALAGLLVIVVGSLYVLTLIPGDKMLKGAIALGGILVAIGVALYGAGKVQDKNSYKTVLAMALMVGVIVAALSILSMISWENLMKSTIALGSVLLALAADFYAMSKIRTKNALPAVLAMIAAVLAIAYSLYTLSEQPWEGLLAAAAAMSATMAAFALSFQMILSKNWSKNNVKKIGTFLLMTLAVIPIGVALAALANQPWDGLLAAAVALSGTMLALAGAFLIVSKAKVDLKAIGAVVAGSASLLLIAAGIALVAQYDVQNIIASAAAIGALVLVMTGVMAACAVLSGVIGPALAGVLGLGAVIVEIGALITAIGGLAQIPGLKWLVEEGGNMLQLIGTAIGQFVGGIVGGVIAGATSQLPQVGSDLSMFMVNLTPFIMGAKMIDPNMAKNVGLIALAIGALTVAELINGIASLLGLRLGDTAIQLSDFMTKLMPFINTAKMIDEESIRACSLIADMIVKLTAAQLIQGISSFLGISGSLSDFAAELEAFGPSIKKFADDVKDVKPEAVQGAAAAAQIMSDVASKLQPHGGFIQKIIGDKSLALFAAELEAFGPSIKQFADDVKDVKPEAVQGAAAAAQIMSEMATKLPDQGGLKAKILGDNKLSDFGAELVAFAPDMVIFSNLVKGVTPESVAGAVAVANMLSSLANNLPNEGGLVSIFTGDNTIAQFGEELVAFGNYMVTFSNSVAGISTGSIDALTTSFKGVVDLATYVQNVSINGLVEFASKASTIGQKITDGIGKGIKSKEPSAITTIQTMCTNLINKFKTSLPEETFTLIGANIVIWLANGISSNEHRVISAANRIANELKRALQTSLTESVFREIGENAAIGLANGIESRIGEIAEAAKRAASESIAAAKNELQEHSPSRATFELGKFFDLGLAKGITAYISAITKSSENASSAAVDRLKDSVYSIGSILESGDYNTDPVIRPIVDLTNVQQGVKDISNMMNQRFDLSATYNRAMSTAASFNTPRTTTYNNDGKISKSGEVNNIEFIQNNYSPKALSAIDIYRQTNNQIGMLKTRYATPNK